MIEVELIIRAKRLARAWHQLLAHLLFAHLLFAVEPR